MKATTMTLRVDTTREGPRVVIRLAGRVQGENLEELRRQTVTGGSPGVVVDLAEVTLVDVEVVRFLRDAETEGVELRHCPAFIRVWITGERDADS
jgi:anti-anti-sigma regulatory factor